MQPFLVSWRPGVWVPSWVCELVHASGVSLSFRRVVPLDCWTPGGKGMAVAEFSLLWQLSVVVVMRSCFSVGVVPLVIPPVGEIPVL